MDDDWDIDDSPAISGSSTPASAAAPAPAAPPPRVARTKFAGEDEEDEEDDWDASENEKPKPKAGAPAAPAKKKMTLKQKLEEKERLAREAKLRGPDNDDLIDTTTEQDRRRQAREREIEADLAVAAELMGGASVEDSKETLQSILTTQPKTKADFEKLSKQIMSAIISRHEANPLFSAFAEALSKDVCESLTAVQTRKVSSAVSVLGNTKQQEERDKASGKKKPASKPKLGAAKVMGKVDTEAYDDVLDDDDFM